MSRLKLERYYEGFVRRGDVGTAIICRSCWDNAERGHRGEIQGEGRYGNEGRNPSLFNGMLPHSFAIILSILIMCLPSGTRRPVSLSPVLEPVAHLAASMKYWAKGLDQCTQKNRISKVLHNISSFLLKHLCEDYIFYSQFLLDLLKTRQE